MASATHTVNLVATARQRGLASRRRRVPKAIPPTLIEADYAHKLVGIVNVWRKATRHVVSALPSLMRQDYYGWRLDIDAGGIVRQLMARVRGEVEQATNDTQIGGISLEYYRRTSQHQKFQLQRQAKAALGIDITTQDTWLGKAAAQFVHENVALIRKLQGATMDGIETMILRALSSGNYSDRLALVDAITKRLDVSERHARLIARDQISRSESSIAELRAYEVGIRKFTWWSMEDQRVRPLHRRLHGQTYEYSNPPAIGLPGNTNDGPLCRCRQRYVWDDVHAAVAAAGDGADLPVPESVPRPR